MLSAYLIEMGYLVDEPLPWSTLFGRHSLSNTSFHRVSPVLGLANHTGWIA